MSRLYQTDLKRLFKVVNKQTIADKLMKIYPIVSVSQKDFMVGYVAADSTLDYDPPDVGPNDDKEFKASDDGGITAESPKLIKDKAATNKETLNEEYH